MERLRFEPLLVNRASEYIEKKIGDAILNEKLRPGDKLPTEREMAEQFAVSLVTLREALRALETVGLIEKRKGKGGGVFVSEIDNKSVKTSLGNYLSFKHLTVKHVYDVRKIIEPQVIKLAIGHVTSLEIAQMEEIISYCEEKLIKAGSHLSKKDYFDLDRKGLEFHRAIAEVAHNPLLSLTIDCVFDILSETEGHILVPDIKFSSDTVRAHRRILEALKRRDALRCEEEMASHLIQLNEYLVGKEKNFFDHRVPSVSGRSLKRR